MPKRVNAPRQGQTVPPLTRAEIEHAQKHTNSNLSAARFLNVSYERYKRYAKIYGLFDSHLNPKGFGTPKGYASRPSSIKLKDIFANKHPTYNIIRLKHRMIARNIIAEECELCKFKERRISDGKIPLILTFRNGKRDYTRDNLYLLCYNCIFLTVGAPTVANQNLTTIVRSFNDPDSIPKAWQVDPRPADQYDLDDTEESPSDVSEFDNMKDEILRELGRE
jgi:hypothetical protein